jgi:hypothetical protein
VSARVVRLLDRGPQPQGHPTLPIVKGIPIPGGVYKRGHGLVRETLKALQVGDSFLATRTQANKCGTLAEELGIEVTTRDAGDGKRRVWRIK